MNVKLKQIRLGCLIMVLSLLLGTVLPTTAFADDKSEQTASLTVINQTENQLIAGADFELYRVASVTSDGGYALEDSFQDASVLLVSGATEGDWSARAVTLESYVVAKKADGDSIAATATEKTNEDGTVTFSNLSTGLYLLVGQQMIIDQKIYTPLATLISLPYSEKNNVSNYNPSIYVKNLVREKEEPTEPDNPTMDLSVIKVWKDEGHENDRPDHVTVSLYRDGVEYSTVELNTENNWKYTWSVPEDTSRWQLVEKEISAKYTVTSVQDGKAFVVTNTYKEETPNTPDTPSKSTLPQTGQLWWPVLLISLCGSVMFFIGLALRRRGNSDHEAE
jgi:type II secretory pathway pseudopilin PulG